MGATMVTRTRVDEMFREAFNGQPNLMTPHVETRGSRGAFVYEISSGEGITGATIYGVTILDLRGNQRHDLSTSFSSYKEALDYLGGLNK